ncbi:unnamed protein product, partial [Tetraodon nigroviridis]
GMSMFRWLEVLEKEFDKAFVGRGPAARRNRPGSSGHHVRGPPEDDHAQLLLRSAVPQSADSVSAQPQAGGGRARARAGHAPS